MTEIEEADQAGQEASEEPEEDIKFNSRCTDTLSSFFGGGLRYH